MNRPNLFDFATSELSQDAFICWLASWAGPEFEASDPALHATAVEFVKRLVAAGSGPAVEHVRSIEVQRQKFDIDVLLIVNGTLAIIVEDKTGTTSHSGQLERYKASVQKAYPNHSVAAVYVKTSDQGNYRSVDGSGYGQFLRRNFLDVMAFGLAQGVKNDIFSDFHERLKEIEEAVQSYAHVPLQAWESDRHVWAGFFLALQQRLGEGDWKHVSNPQGGFMAFWWHSRDGKYLQLEESKLTFKVSVAATGPEEQTRSWKAWNQAVLKRAESKGFRLTTPRRKAGKTMTVAVLDGDYRCSDADGRLNFEQTVERLRAVAAIVDGGDDLGDGAI